MQDIHSMGAGRLFTGGGGGDRRLRPHQHQNHQVLKCPRCESLNTKFCYYNNYNLSQPRHFCKSCRRYWTKGGVLRNVPVGGGCRKTKRSKAKPSSERERTKSNSHSHSHSSSESSSLTATTTAAVTPTTATTTTVEAVSAHSSNLLKINNNNNNSNNSNDDSKYFEHVNPNNSTSFEHSLIEQGADCGIFSEIGSFTSLITSTNETLSFGFNNIMNHHHHHHQGLEQNQQWQQQQQKMVSMGSGGEELKMQEILDQTLQVELSALQNRSGNGGFESLDWQGSGGDQGLFDLPNAVDQSYWSQSQWSDQDHPTLYLP